MGLDSSYLKVNVLQANIIVIIGNFIIALATYLTLYYGQRFDYLALIPLSAGVTSLVGAGASPNLLGLRRFPNYPMAPLLGAGGALLAAEMVIVGTLFPDAVAAAYAVSTLLGSGCILHGVAKTESLKLIPRRPREDRATVLIPSQLTE